MGVVMSDAQHVGVTLTAVDAAGNPATLSGAPSWAVDNATILSVTAAADGLSADVVALGPEGDATVTATVVDAANNSITGQLSVTIIGGAPVSLVLTPGTPAAKP